MHDSNAVTAASFIIGLSKHGPQDCVQNASNFTNYKHGLSEMLFNYITTNKKFPKPWEQITRYLTDRSYL